MNDTDEAAPVTMAKERRADHELGGRTLDAISAGRVSQRRQWSDRNSQDCYRYAWLLDGEPAPARMVRELGSLYAEAAIVPGGFGTGAGEVGVTVR